MRRAQRARARLGVAAIACGSLLAALVVPSAPASAQIADGVFVGQIVDFGIFPTANAFENRVTLEVFGGGTSIRGHIRLVIGGEIAFETRSSEICVAIDAEVPSTSVLGGGASGSVPVTTTSADGPCGPTSDLTGPVVTSADFSVAFEDRRLRGTLTLPGDQPTAISFVAERGDAPATATPQGGDAETTSSTGSLLPGLEEAIAARSLDPASLDRINELTNGCIDPQHVVLSPGCFDLDELDGFTEYAKLRLGAAASDSDDIGLAIGLAALRDDRGSPLLPSLAPLVPVLVQLQRNARQPGEQGAIAANSLTRLLGLVVALDLAARS
jgi:hypothetical protein